MWNICWFISFKRYGNATVVSGCISINCHTIYALNKLVAIVKDVITTIN